MRAFLAVKKELNITTTFGGKRQYGNLKFGGKRQILSIGSEKAKMV